MNKHDETAENKLSGRRQELKSRRMPRKITMRHSKKILAAAGLLFATGAMGTAQADDDRNGTVLYTSATRGGRLSCIAVNVSKKALTITMSIIDGTGTEPTVLAGPTQIVTDPGLEASLDLGQFTDPSSEGYCVFQLSGTRNRDDVRAVLVSNKATTQTLPDNSTFPYFITRVIEAH
jgi:hypothetical protein